MTHYENYCKHLPTLSGQHRIVATDNPINGQNSVYVVTETNGLPVAQIAFQTQSYDKDGTLRSEYGVTELDLLEILQDRLRTMSYCDNLDCNLDSAQKYLNNALYFFRQYIILNSDCVSTLKFNKNEEELK